jgi:nucleoside-diphosphate-sugar epimerase
MSASARISWLVYVGRRRKTTTRAVLVTGVAGFISSHVVRALRAARYRIVVVDDLLAGTERRFQERLPSRSAT